MVEKVLHPNGCLVVTLNRPRALNALNMEMIELLWQVFREAESSGDVKLIVLKGAGDRAFCAGGDIRVLAEESKKGNYAYPHRFFGEEYRLDCFIHHLKKPCLALINGITMGGGVGLAIGCKYRVATESTTFAMPETAIGFFPDVGGSYFLSRLPDGVGNYLALMGARLGAPDVLHCNIATHFVPKAKLAKLEEELCKADLGAVAVDSVLSTYASQPEGQIEVVEHEASIQRYFHVASAEEIYERLQEEKDKNAWAETAHKILHKKSPTSVKVTFAALQKGRGMSIDEVFEMDLRVACRFMESHDFIEGVNAVIIEKHHDPQWKPSHHEEVSEDVVSSFFVPFTTASRELWAHHQS